MTDTSPANFANLPKDELKEIASKGGKASHGPHNTTGENQVDEKITAEGRNPDGTFTKGSEAAKEAGHVGGLHARGKTEAEADMHDHEHEGRREHGTLLPGSEVAREAGHKGGLAAAAASDK